MEHIFFLVSAMSKVKGGDLLNYATFQCDRREFVCDDSSAVVHASSVSYRHYLLYELRSARLPFEISKNRTIDQVI